MAVVHNNQILWDIGHDNMTTDKDNNNEQQKRENYLGGKVWMGGRVDGRAGRRKADVRLAGRAELVDRRAGGRQVDGWAEGAQKRGWRA